MSFYPEPPGRRLAWDIDGSLLNGWQDGEGTPNTASQGSMTAINSEANYRWRGFPDIESWGWISIVFPDYRDISGIFVCDSKWSNYANDRSDAVEVSTDTTNGIDGNWTQIYANLPNISGVQTWRTQITPLSATDVLGIRYRRFRWIDDVGNIHVYGENGNAASRDKLEIKASGPWDIDSVWNYGNVERDHTSVTKFYVSNTSQTLTAIQVGISVESLTGPSGSWYSFSADDTVYTSTIDLGDITHGNYKEFYVKQILPGDTAIGPASARMRAEASVWV